MAGSIFEGNSNGTIDNGAKGIYWVQNADVLTPYGSGATAVLSYTANTNGAAGIQYDGSAGGGKVVYFAFPFEAITTAARRDAYMEDILAFFAEPLSFKSAALLADGRLRLVLSGQPGVYSLDSSMDLTNWSFAASLTNVAGIVEFTTEPVTNQVRQFFRARSGP